MNKEIKEKISSLVFTALVVFILHLLFFYDEIYVGRSAIFAGLFAVLKFLFDFIVDYFSDKIKKKRADKSELNHKDGNKID